MTKYLMLDHGGVLDGEMSLNPGPNDLILSDLGEGVQNILKDGVSIVQNLHTLVNEHGYHIVFHSKNRENDQLRILEQLHRACKAKNILFPTVEAMPVCDNDAYPTILPTAATILSRTSENIRQQYPEIAQVGAIQVVGYGQAADGKLDVRQAIEHLCAMSGNRINKAESIVFDDGGPVIDAARQEGYQAYRIATEAEQGGSLAQATADILKKLNEKNNHSESRESVVPPHIPQPSESRGSRIEAFDRTLRLKKHWDKTVIWAITGATFWLTFSLMPVGFTTFNLLGAAITACVTFKGVNKIIKNRNESLRAAYATHPLPKRPREQQVDPAKQAQLNQAYQCGEASAKSCITYLYRNLIALGERRKPAGYNAYWQNGYVHGLQDHYNPQSNKNKNRG